MNYAPRVTVSYADVSNVIIAWSESCQKMAVFEHEPDDEVPQVHLHILIEGCIYDTAEALKRSFYRIYPTERKGNNLWAWTHKEHPNVANVDTEGGMKYLSYMTKGIYAAKFLKNISPDLVDKAKAMWVSKSPVDHLPAESRNEFDIILKQLTQLYHDKPIPSPSVLKADICYL